jgi:NO-binding membrane sensor protein with MHYT domain
VSPTLIPTGFDPSYVILSFIVSAVGAFVALTAAANIAAAPSGRRIDRINLWAAALALGGIGIWSMHFIGMLALHADLGIGYAMPETLASLLIAVAGTGYALHCVARHRGSVRHVLIAGAVLGLAVCAMHYLGMYGMRFGGFLQWSPGLVAASVGIAWLAATAAMALAFAVRSLAGRARVALVMAGAVCAMHYTGMAAAQVVCTTSTPGAIPTGWGVVSSMELPMLVIVVALGIAFVISIDQFFQHVGSVQPKPARR